MTPIEQSIIDLIRKIRYGEIVVKIEDCRIADVIEKHHHKPRDLISALPDAEKDEIQR